MPTPGLPSVEVSQVPVLLEANVSPKGKLIGITIFSIFWNGIVSVVAWFALESWRRGDPEWFLIIFLIPFVLIGLGTIVGIGYYFLALFNPRPKLIVSSDSVPFGGSLDLEWQMAGRAHLVQRLRIYLEGREEATYRRGTRTYTDKETFATIEIVDVSGPGSMYGDRTRVTLSRDTMHSFEGDHNKIVWSLHVKGDIKRWPDIEEEFEMVVLPMSPSPGW